MDLIYPLFILTILYPAGVSVAACFGYRFELLSPFAFSLGLAVLSVAATVCAAVSKEAPKNKSVRVFSALLTPFSLINALFYSISSLNIWVLPGMLISAGCALYLTLRQGKPIALKVIALVLSALLAAPVGILCFLFPVFGSIGQNSVVQTVASPSGEYYAAVIDSDQGALGGDTLVDVYENSRVDLIFFRIEKKPQRVYLGDWRDYEGMDIRWEDDHRLVINGHFYQVE